MSKIDKNINYSNISGHNENDRRNAEEMPLFRSEAEARRWLMQTRILNTDMTVNDIMRTAIIYLSSIPEAYRESILNESLLCDFNVEIEVANKIEQTLSPYFLPRTVRDGLRDAVYNGYISQDRLANSQLNQACRRLQDEQALLKQRLRECCSIVDGFININRKGRATERIKKDNRENFENINKKGSITKRVKHNDRDSTIKYIKDLEKRNHDSTERIHRRYF